MPGTMMKVAVAAVPAMNAVDAAFTSHWLMTGVATEANPVMAAAFAVSPEVFVVAKMVMACTGVGVLARYGKRATARAGMAVTAAAYAAVCAYHVAFAFS
jgi:hypothetical protein